MRRSTHALATFGLLVGLALVCAPVSPATANEARPSDYQLFLNQQGVSSSTLVSGKIPTARLGSGTASSSTYLRGDQTWATPAGGSEAFPVGSIFIGAVSTDPATLLGYGSLSGFCAGRVLVGIDAGQTEFDTNGETGGAKTHTLTEAQIPGHNHTQDAHGHTQDAHTHTQDAHSHVLTQLRDATTGGATTNIALTADTSSTLGTKVTGSSTATNQNATATNQNATATNQATGGGGSHPILNPYIVVYMWKRDS